MINTNHHYSNQRRQICQKNNNIPEDLKIFLGAVKSELMDPKNRHKKECNISKELLEALLQLIKLQRDREIVIKRCDKGAGIIVLDFDEYMRACNVHLQSKLKMVPHKHITLWLTNMLFKVQRRSLKSS